MPKAPAWICLLLLVLGANLVAAAPLVTNSEFSEISPAGAPEGWTAPEALAGAVDVADDEGHSGSDSLRFTLAEGAEVQGVGQKVACETNTEYVLSAWLKSAELRPSVRVMGMVAGRAGIIAGVDLTDAERWQGLSARFNTGRLTEFTVTILAHSAPGATPAGVAWVDDVQVWPAAEYQADEGMVSGGYAGAPPGPNIALNKPYTLSPGPNYGYCTDDDDTTQLTDGEYSVGYFWVQKGTVGWSGAPYADIIIDLGDVHPIKGCSFNTAAGVAGVAWPALIHIMVSEDRETWYAGGDLITRSARFGLPAPDAYSTHRYVADDLKLHGRYFRVLVAGSGAYTFCDEIEVYEGPEELLQADLGEPVEGDPTEVIVSMRVAAAVRQRLLKDIEALREEAKAVGVSDDTRAWVEKEAQRLTEAAQNTPDDFDVKWRAIHPLTSTHAEIYKARARVKRELGASTFVAWRKCRWDMLDPMELPEGPASSRRLELHALAGEYRSAAVNASNMSDRDIALDVSVNGLPGAPKPDYVNVHQVEWIETQSGIPVADALPLAEETDNGWRVTVPAGMTRQIWLTFHPTDVEAGSYQGNVMIGPDLSDAKSTSFPMRLRVYPLELPEKLSCSIGLWDYSCGKSYDMTDSNVDAAIANMQSHFIDTPWASGGCAPWPDGFDAEGNMVGELDFDRFDGWIADWRDASNYAVFLHVGGSLRNVPMADERFPSAVAQWMNAWVAHLRELEVKPSQLMLLLVDEPSAEEQDQRIMAWAKAIKAAEPEVIIWEDPVYRAPESLENIEMFEVSDVLCPNLGIFANGTPAHRDFYAKLLEGGKTLWFYQCSGPTKTFDPYYYYRLQHWYCFKYGATGSGFWAYADAARTGNSWNELRAGRASYTPVYIDEDSVTDSKHFEAVREGLEDYELLRMVRDRAGELARNGKRERAAPLLRLLETAVDDVCGAGYDPGQVSWVTDKDRTVADTARVKLLEALTRD